MQSKTDRWVVVLWLEYNIGDFWLNWTETQMWELVASTGSAPSARYYHSCVVYKDSMYVLGGFSGKKNVKDLFQFNMGNFAIAVQICFGVGVGVIEQWRENGQSCLMKGSQHEEDIKLCCLTNWWSFMEVKKIRWFCLWCHSQELLGWHSGV